MYTTDPTVMLSPFSTCDIADALSKLTPPVQGYIPDLVMYSPTCCCCGGNSSGSGGGGSGRNGSSFKLLGPAHTIKLVKVSDTLAPKPEGHHVDSIPTGSVVVVEAPEGVPNAVWGGLLSTRAQYLGAKGVIIDGRIRDLQEQREMGFPVFARGTSCLGAGGYTRASTISEPIRLRGGIEINEGDMMVADIDGVVRIPAAHVSEVVKYCRQLAETDAKCMEDLKRGRSISDSFREHRGTS